MTIDTAALRALCEKATPPPWACRGNVLDIQEEARLFCVSTEDGLPHVQDENDITFIAAARTALPELLDRVEKLEWLVEVMSLFADECCNLVLREFELCACEELEATYKQALRDAGH